MDLNSYFLYIFISFFYILSPGLAVFLVIQYSAIFKYKNIVFLILGNISGLAILAFISAIGVGIIISNSIFLTNIIKYIGALVLLYIAIKMFFSKASQKNTNSDINSDKSYYQFYKEGLLLAISNPKPIIFFTSIYPQFIKDDENKILLFIVLAITFMLLSFIILNVYSFISRNTLGKVLNEKRINIFNKISSIALILTAIFIIAF